MSGDAREGGTRAVKIAAIAMGVLILLGTTVIVVTIIRRVVSGSQGLPEKPFAAVLDEPEGTVIVGIAQVSTAQGGTGQTRDRVAVHLRGGGADRVLLIDPGSGAIVGRVSLAR
jgi:hypothetical protein